MVAGYAGLALQTRLADEHKTGETKAVVLDEMLVERLDREALIALAIEPLDFLRPVRRDPPARRLAEPPVKKPGLAILTRQRRVQRRNVRSLTPSNSAASA